jgi:hypothetical protein
MNDEAMDNQPTPAERLELYEKKLAAMSVDELLLETVRSGGPMAPDRPRGFNPHAIEDQVRKAPIIYARLPEGPRVLLFARVKGKPVSQFDIMFGDVPRDTPTLDVRCEDEEDVDLLRALIRSVKKNRK